MFTLFSTARRGTPSQSASASAIVADTASGYHDLRIEGYSRTKDLPNGECLKSCPFTVGGHRWLIDYYPNGKHIQHRGYISLYLNFNLDENVTKDVRARFKFSFRVDKQVPSFLKKKKQAQLSSAYIYNFAIQRDWGYPNFIRRKALERSEHLKGDSFTVRCDIVVMNGFRTDGTSTSVPVPPSDLHRHLGDLLLTKKGTDVVFEVGGETFAAHRWLLAARSPVFGAELFGAMKEGDIAGVVRIDDMEAQVFKALLCFVYTDSLPELKKEEEDVMSQHLLVAADRYGMERLKLICEDRLCTYIDVGTVATILLLADQHHCDGLKNACFAFLSSPANLKAVMGGDGFKHLCCSCPSIMMELTAKLAL